ncbi:MAG: hypothetical protein A2W05_06055 [Candidatus Schekmanbacteria bacterium RBG_16_38_10]|uniref:Lipoyl-binding domain-containing protein n=1 Tax=Candidatus Schekmanbacteria bacterium RBG_16_38_10 TaxID=1817879 RepID=A0A1F7RU49_9BACT|nr:MAG: hypothetical protein A2W05_06055 [Candidatus Schekmanbacteria bacterium RBG_16_38_10]
MNLEVIINNKEYNVEIERKEKSFLVKIDDEEFDVDATVLKKELYSLIVSNKSYLTNIKSEENKYIVDVNSESFEIEVFDEATKRTVQRKNEAGSGKQIIKAPMPGKIVKILVKEGEEVEPGSGMIVVEAMKMENELKSSSKGVVKEIAVEEGVAVNAGDTLIVVE